MSDITVIDEGVRTVKGELVGGRVLVDAGVATDVLGWELKPEGLCRGSRCVPFPTKATGNVDLADAAGAIGRPAVIESGLGVVAVAFPSEERKRVLDSLEAAPFTLPDLDGKLHELAEWQGRKRLLIAFSTW